jgi:hypothetical protein
VDVLRHFTDSEDIGVVEAIEERDLNKNKLNIFVGWVLPEDASQNPVAKPVRSSFSKRLTDARTSSAVGTLGFAVFDNWIQLFLNSLGAPGNRGQFNERPCLGHFVDVYVMHPSVCNGNPAINSVISVEHALYTTVLRNDNRAPEIFAGR